MELLLLEMLVFLLVAFLLGLILGWLLARKANKQGVISAPSSISKDSNSFSNKKIVSEDENKTVERPTPAFAQKVDFNEEVKQAEEKILEEVKPASAPTISEVNYSANVTAKQENNKKNIVTPVVTNNEQEKSVSSTASPTLGEIDLGTEVDLNGKGYGIQHIEGIGPKTGDALRAIGINKVGDLLKITLRPEQRASLAAQLNLKQEYIDKWASMCDFLRIKGVDHQASELINVAGPRNIKEFASVDAQEFVARMKELNEAKSKHIAPEVPNVEAVSNWVEQAKNLKNLVNF